MPSTEIDFFQQQLSEYNDFAACKKHISVPPTFCSSMCCKNMLTLQNQIWKNTQGGNFGDKSNRGQVVTEADQDISGTAKLC